MPHETPTKILLGESEQPTQWLTARCESYLSVAMVDDELPDEQIAAAMADVPVLA
jgi:hypothetical protein